MTISCLREAPTQKMPLLFGHCPFGGGVSTLARMVWSTYLEKNCLSSNEHLLDCGRVKMLARMAWGTYTVKIEVQMGNCLIVEESKMLARMVWGTYSHQHSDLTKMLNSVRK